jgi:hypothetical protein
VNALKFWKTEVTLKRLNLLVFTEKLTGKTFAHGTENYFHPYLDALGCFFSLLSNGFITYKNQ